MTKIRNTVLWGLTFSLLITTSWFTMRILQVVLRGEAHEEGLADGNWVIAENLHFFNRERHSIHIYSRNLTYQEIDIDNMRLHVVPLVLEPGRCDKSGTHFINVNDSLLLKYACQLAVKNVNRDLALILLGFLKDNDSDSSNRDIYSISSCVAYLHGDQSQEHFIEQQAAAYSYLEGIYSERIGVRH